MGDKLFHSDGGTERHTHMTKIIVAFCMFPNAPKIAYLKSVKLTWPLCELLRLGHERHFISVLKWRLQYNTGTNCQCSISTKREITSALRENFLYHVFVVVSTETWARHVKFAAEMQPSYTCLQVINKDATVHAMKVYGGQHVYLHSWTRHNIKVSGQLHAQAAMPPAMIMVILWTGSLEVPRAGLDALESRNTWCPCQESIYDSSVLQTCDNATPWSYTRQSERT
jgi:hypothetical protein